MDLTLTTVHRRHASMLCLVFVAAAGIACGGDPLIRLSAKLDVSPDPIDVALVRGEFVRVPVLLRSLGDAPLEITELSVRSDDGRVTLVAAPSLAMAAHSEQTIELRVDAREGDPADAVLHIESNGGNSDVDVRVQLGDAPVGCILTPQPSPLHLVAEAAGSAVTATVTFTNNGAAACTILSIAMANDDSDFVLGPVSNVTLAPGGAVSSFVTFAVPPDAEPFAQSDALVVDVLETDDVTVPVSIGYLAQALCLSETQLGFGALATPTTRTVIATSCGGIPVTISDVSTLQATAALAIDNDALPLTLPVGTTTTLRFTVDPTITDNGSATVVITSDDPVADTIAVVWGEGSEEVCHNGIDDDGDTLIDEFCVEGPSLGRAVTLGAGRLMVWGDEHVLFEDYGPAPVAFWINALRWLGGDAPVVDLRGDIGPQIEAAVAALGGTLASIDPDTAGAGHVMLMGWPSGTSLRSYIERGGGALFLARGIDVTECVNGLDAATQDLPLHYSCVSPAPWGPVTALHPHPITDGLGLDAVPFVNGQYVVEDDGVGSTVLAVP